MSGVEVVFLVVLLVPLFVAKWRVSLLGLGAQGVLLWAAAGGHASRLDAVIDLVDFLVLRGGLAPALLFLAFRRPGMPARNDVIPANLFAWMIVVLLVLMSFHFAQVMEPGGGRHGRTAVAITGFVLGFFVLATQESVFSQIVGALRIENAIALLETSEPGDHAAALVRVAQVVVMGGAIGLYVWYLRGLAAAEPAGRHTLAPGPVEP